MAGKASLENNLKELGIELSEENRKIVLDRIIELGDQKKTITLEDLPFIIADVLKLPEKRNLRFDNVVITSGKGVTPVCSLWLNYKKKEYKVIGQGDGGYDAFMNSVREWARTAKINLPILKDYEIRIPPGGRTSALVECKITWATNEKKIVTTRGVDSDQTMAAIYATEKMLNILL